ncbi:hypothetical protein BHM03_00006974 [Ensete ventricosum]|nr:hypothetical protein BHM03_00006974 [Ensete ventricosum]
MIGVAEDLDCSSAYIRLRGLDKSEDKAENCSENTNVLKQVVERGEEATTSPKGLSYRKAKRRSKWSVGRERGWGGWGGVSEPGAVCVPATTTTTRPGEGGQGGARMEERGDRRGGVKEGGAVVQEEKDEKGACDAEGGRGGEYR